MEYYENPIKADIKIKSRIFFLDPPRVAQQPREHEFVKISVECGMIMCEMHISASLAYPEWAPFGFDALAFKLEVGRTDALLRLSLSSASQSLDDIRAILMDANLYGRFAPQIGNILSRDTGMAGCGCDWTDREMKSGNRHETFIDLGRIFGKIQSELLFRVGHALSDDEERRRAMLAKNPAVMAV